MSRSLLVTSLAISTAAIAAAGLGCSDDRPAPAAGTGAGGAMSVPDAGGSGGMTDSVCPVATGAVDPTALLDDFEDTNSLMPLLAGRRGGWFASGDATTGAILNPMGDAPPESIPGGRCGSRRALHVTGSGFNDWGSIVGVAMHSGVNSAGVYEEQPYDALARGYQGISFFARVGDTSSTTVRFAVSDQFARPEAGLCVPGGTQDNTCYDTFGVVLTHDLDTQWKEFRIPFNGLSQQNFGLQGGAAPDISKLYDLSFNFPSRVVFDLWVDDIRFY